MYNYIHRIFRPLLIFTFVSKIFIAKSEGTLLIPYYLRYYLFITYNLKRTIKDKINNEECITNYFISYSM